jgi:hypothetical protein
MSGGAGRLAQLVKTRQGAFSFYDNVIFTIESTKPNMRALGHV